MKSTAERITSRTEFQVAMLLVAAGLTYLSVPKLVLRQVDVAVSGDVGTSVILLAVGLGLGWRQPQTGFNLLLACQLPLYLISVGGGLGSSIVVYLNLSLVVAYCYRIEDQRTPRTKSLPGTVVGLCLLGLIFLQWVRSSDLKDNVRVLLDASAAVLVFSKLPTLGPTALRNAARSYVWGVTGTSLILLSEEFGKSPRLGTLLHFNPDAAGYAAGAAILIVLSKEVFGLAVGSRVLLSAPLTTLLYFSGGRGAFFGALAGALVLLTLQRRYKLLFAISPIAIGGVYFMITGLQDTTFLVNRLVSPFTESFSESSSQRDHIWGYLLNDSDAHWLVGGGIGDTQRLTEEGGLIISGHALQSHNVYLTLLIESGILGVLLFVLMQAKIVAFAARAPAATALMSAMFAYYLVQGFFSGMNFGFEMAFMLTVAFTTRERVASRMLSRAWSCKSVRQRLSLSPAAEQMP